VPTPVTPENLISEDQENLIVGQLHLHVGGVALYPLYPSLKGPGNLIVGQLHLHVGGVALYPLYPSLKGPGNLIVGDLFPT